MKKVKFTVNIEVELPDNSELIRLTDSDGEAVDLVRVSGKLICPSVHWLEYISDFIAEERYPNNYGGFGYDPVSDEFVESKIKTLVEGYSVQALD